jgi:signal transduction histidine kinase
MPPTTTSAIARFMAGSLLAIAVVVAGGYFLLRSVTVDQAERDTRRQVVLQGRLVQAAGLGDGVLDGAPAALRRLDDVVVGQVLTNRVVRVKVWTRDGRILYSDEPRLIGQQFELGADEVDLFDDGGADAELSDLSKPENRYEREESKLLEAHTVIRTPDGTPVLFETYQRFSSISADGADLLRKIAPTLLGALAVLLLFQVPLAFSLARRLRRGHAEREHLLHTAIEASDAERRRIASDLHDGVVQDVAGVAFGLAPLADAAARRGDPEASAALEDATTRLRQGVRDLRTLLVQIHPPNLETAGIEPALADLLSPLATAGLTTSLDVDAAACASSPHDALVYRVAREALRNVAEHAGATAASVTLRCPAPGRVRLEVTDDGAGFTPAQRDQRSDQGHVGLRLLEDLARQSGATLTVSSAAGEGTTVVLETGTA